MKMKQVRVCLSGCVNIGTCQCVARGRGGRRGEGEREERMDTRKIRRK